MERDRAAYATLLHSAAQSETVITVNQGLRGGKVIELKKTVDQAVKQCPGVKRVLVSMRTDSKVPMTALDVPLEEVRGCPALLPLPLRNVSTLGAGTGVERGSWLAMTVLLMLKQCGDIVLQQQWQLELHTS